MKAQIALEPKHRKLTLTTPPHWLGELLASGTVSWPRCVKGSRLTLHSSCGLAVHENSRTPSADALNSKSAGVTVVWRLHLRHLLHDRPSSPSQHFIFSLRHARHLNNERGLAAQVVTQGCNALQGAETYERLTFGSHPRVSSPKGMLAGLLLTDTVGDAPRTQR